MSDVIEIQRLRGDEADKLASTRVLPEGQTAVVLDEAYQVLGDGTTELKDLRPMEDRRIDTVNDTDGPLVMTNVSPSIIAADTTDGACDVELPSLASNLGRKVYIINVEGVNDINVTADGSDTIGADREGSIIVAPTITTTILIAHASYWEQVSTGGGVGVGADYTLAEAFSALEVGAVDASGEAVLADISDAAKDEVVGVATRSGSIGDSIRFQNKGILEGFTGLTIGAHYYANTTGGYTEGTAHIGQGSRRWYIGMAVAADTMFLDVREVQPEATIQDPVPIGFIAPFGMDSAPVSWLECDGTEISRAQYSELFAEIGTTWGVGDGSTTFNLPDLQGLGVRGTGSNLTATKADGSPYVGPAVGSIENDQMQGHWHDAKQLNGGGTDGRRWNGDNTATDSISANALDRQINSPSSDGTNGTPRTGDETRGAAAGVLWCIKASRITATGEPITSLRYDTGWVANSDWTDATFAINHNLGTELPSLLVKVFLSPDGTDASALELKPANDYGSTADDVGWNVHGVDANNIQVRTADNGFYVIKANGLTEYLNTEAWYYRVLVYKPEIFARSEVGLVRTLTADYTITGRQDARIFNVTTGATDRTITLPDGADMVPGDRIGMAKTDSGAGDAILAAAGTDTINGAASVTRASQYGFVEVMWMGAGLWIETALL